GRPGTCYRCAVGRAWITVIALLALGAAAYLALRPRAPQEDPPAPPPARELALPAEIEVLFVGAVGDPSMAQVQIEQDLELAQRLFAGPSFTLFGGGPDARFVHELTDEAQATGIRLALTELFSKRSVSFSYREPKIQVDGPGTLEALDLAFGHARAADAPLPLLYVAGHGERGDVPGEGYFTL